MATVSVSPSNSVGTMRYICAIGSVTIVEHLGVDVQVGERDDAEVQLFGERLGELIVVDQAHVHGDLAEHLAGTLLLLFDEQFELLVGDIAEVDQDLSDAALGHGRVSG